MARRAENYVFFEKDSALLEPERLKKSKPSSSYLSFTEGNLTKVREWMQNHILLIPCCSNLGQDNPG